MTSPAPTVRLAFDRNLAWCEGGSVRYLTAEVTAPPAPPREPGRAPRKLNVALVIDASGSMAGAPIEYARRAAKGIVEALSEGDRLSIVSFASEVAVHVDARPMDGPGKAAALAAIGALDTRDSTNLFDGWLKGAELAAAVMEREPGRQNRVILLSDGHANAGELDPSVLERHASELQQRGLLTSCVGIGDGYSSVQLAALASAGGGRLHDAERPHEIIEVVVAELREMVATVAEQVALTLAWPAGVHAEILNGFNSVAAGASLVVSLGSLVGGARRTSIFRLALPVGEAGATLEFSAHITWRRPGEPEQHAETPISAALRFARGMENSAQPRDIAVSLQVAEVWQAAIVRRIVALNRQRAGGEATAVLRKELGFFAAYCEGLPGAERLVDELREIEGVVHQDWDERGRKEMELLSYSRRTMNMESRSIPRPAAYAAFLPKKPEKR